MCKKVSKFGQFWSNFDPPLGVIFVVFSFIFAVLFAFCFRKNIALGRKQRSMGSGQDLGWVGLGRENNDVPQHHNPQAGRFDIPTTGWKVVPQKEKKGLQTRPGTSPVWMGNAIQLVKYVAGRV